jgi:hypothetical protein
MALQILKQRFKMRIGYCVCTVRLTIVMYVAIPYIAIHIHVGILTVRCYYLNTVSCISTLVVFWVPNSLFPSLFKVSILKL